jgi:tRNA threonylcarbamoyladenosine modification (KEOPS) complex Cgi121 subunit
MNSGCSIPQLIGVMQQIRRSIQIGSKKRQRLVIFGSDEMVRMFYAPFKRDTIRDILMERLHAQKE